MYIAKWHDNSVVTIACNWESHIPVFVNLLNTTVFAALKIHCQIGEKKIIHIDFRRQVTLCLLKIEQHREIASSVAAELPLNVCFDAVKHFLGHATSRLT